jgi:hypothetical protein
MTDHLLERVSAEHTACHQMRYAVQTHADAQQRVWYSDELTAIQAGRASGREEWRVLHLPEWGYTVVPGRYGHHDMVDTRLCIRYRWCEEQKRYRQQ